MIVTRRRLIHIAVAALPAVPRIARAQAWPRSPCEVAREVAKLVKFLRRQAELTGP